MEAYEQAKMEAVKQVLLDISQTGKPTEAQLSFLRMVKKEDPLGDLSKALKVADSFMGVAK